MLKKRQTGRHKKTVTQIHRLTVRHTGRQKYLQEEFHSKTASKCFNLLYFIHSLKVLLLWMLFIMAFGTTFYMIMAHVSYRIPYLGALTN